MTETSLAPLSPADSFAFRNAADAQISPDAQRICYLHTHRDLAADSKRTVLMLSRDRRSFTELPGSDGCIIARWAPDSRRLAMLRRQGANTALVVHDTDGGTPV